MSVRPIQQFAKGQAILQEGSLGDRSYKIISGEVVICKQGSNGNLVPVAKLGCGEFFGEMYLFDSQHRRTATAIAISGEVVVEVYYQEEFTHIFQTLSPATQNIFKGLSKRLKKISGNYVEMVEPKQAPVQLPDGAIRESTVIKRSNEQ